MSAPGSPDDALAPDGPPERHGIAGRAFVRRGVARGSGATLLPARRANTSAESAWRHSTSAFHHARPTGGTAQRFELEEATLADLPGGMPSGRRTARSLAERRARRFLPTSGAGEDRLSGSGSD